MQMRSFECVGDQGNWQAVTICQQFCLRGRHLHAAFLTLVGVLLSTPFMLIAADKQATEHAVGLMSSAPATALQLLVLLTIGAAALACGLALMVQPAVSKRDIEIQPQEVRVGEQIGRIYRTWSEPLDAYNGMRHRVTTTSSGPIHSLVLEHTNRDRSLVIANAPHLGDGAIAAASEELNLPVLTGKPRKTFGISRRPSISWSRLTPWRTHFEQNVGT